MTSRLQSFSIRRMHPGRAVAAALAAAVVAFVPAPGAHADAKTSTFDKTAWFWSSNSKVTTCSDDPAVGVCGGASATGGVVNNGGGIATPISAGHLGVSMKDGGSDIRSYVHVDLGQLPDGAVISSLKLVMNVSAQNAEHAQRHASVQQQPPATSNAAAAAIQACPAVEPWGPAEGDPPSSTVVARPHPESADATAEVETIRNEPFYDCALGGARGSQSKDGLTWTFDLTSIAKKWQAGEFFNEGVALLPVNTSVGATWTVEFHGAPLTVAGSNGDVTYVTQDEASKAVIEYAMAAAPTPAYTPPAITPNLPSFPSFGNPIPAADPFVPAPDTGGGDVRQDQGSSGTITPVATNPKIRAWVLGFLPIGVLGLGLISGALAEEPVPVRTGSWDNGSRVAAVLRSRRLAGAERLREGE